MQIYPADINLIARVRRYLRGQIEHAEALVDGARTEDVRDHLRERDRLLRDERELANLQGRLKATQIKT